MTAAVPRAERILVVNVMPHGPAYDFAPAQRPDVAWARSDGSWVGFWTREWPDLLGEAVLRRDPALAWEVWQPDARADGVYAATLDTGVVHRLFPARPYRYRPGLRPVAGLRSEAILAGILELQHRPVIVQLHGMRVPFYTELLERLDPARRCRVVIVGHGLARSPVSELVAFHRPMTYACLLAEQWRLRRALRKADVLSEQTTTALRDLRRVFAGRIERLTMGCDFDFWCPARSAEARRAAREELGVRPGQTVFFASGNFVARKQLDRLVEAFRALEARDDWFLLIAGHGDAPNTERLATAITPLTKAGKALRHPYIEGAGLRALYWASDVYVSVATDEAGPVSVMKALACGVPVLTTPVGATWEIMTAHAAGTVVEATAYRQWVTAIAAILDGALPPALDVAVARRAFDWRVVANQAAALYRDLVA